jgi:hypothetical protein
MTRERIRFLGHPDKASSASGRNGPPDSFAFWCHPDDLNNARGGNGFWPPDSFAHAKPVPVPEIAQRSFADVKWKLGA